MNKIKTDVYSIIKPEVEKLKKPEGALVASVGEKSPADKAGIETGDVIVEFDGMSIKGVDHLRNNVSISNRVKNAALVCMMRNIMIC